MKQKMQNLEELFEEAYGRIEQKTALAIEVSEKLAKAQSILEEKQAELLNSGTVKGSNAETRKAEMRVALDPYYKSVEELEAANRSARNDLEKAIRELELLKTRLRIYEIVSRVM